MLANGLALIENGAVQVFSNRIQFVGRWPDVLAQKRAGERVIDLGETLLTPGLINSHCHLDLATLPTNTKGPPRSFTNWAQQVVQLRITAQRDSLVRNFQKNALDLLRSGCATALHIGTEPTFEAAPDHRENGPNIVQFAEITGVLSGAEPRALVKGAVDRILNSANNQPITGIAPHAPYSTQRETLLELASRTRNTPSTIHLAESEDEFDLFQASRGPLWDWLNTKLKHRPTRGETPVEYVDRTGLLRPDCLIAHANYLTLSDFQRIQRAGSMIVHCPRSHAYFGHRPFPLERARKYRLPVCLGTDSLASTRASAVSINTLSMLEEGREFLRTFPNETPESTLSMMTEIPGAYAGFCNQIGSIRPGFDADFAVFEYAGKVENAIASLIFESAHAQEMWIKGNRHFVSN